MYERLHGQRAKMDTRIQEQQRAAEAASMQECTFAPRVNLNAKQELKGRGDPFSRLYSNAMDRSQRRKTPADLLAMGYTFKPSIDPASNEIAVGSGTRTSGSEGTAGRLYERGVQKHAAREQAYKAKKLAEEEAAVAACTFKPHMPKSPGSPEGHASGVPVYDRLYHNARLRQAQQAAVDAEASSQYEAASASGHHTVAHSSALDRLAKPRGSSPETPAPAVVTASRPSPVKYRKNISTPGQAPSHAAKAVQGSAGDSPGEDADSVGSLMAPEEAAPPAPPAQGVAPPPAPSASTAAAAKKAKKAAAAAAAKKQAEVEAAAAAAAKKQADEEAAAAAAKKQAEEEATTAAAAAAAAAAKHAEDEATTAAAAAAKQAEEEAATAAAAAA